MKRMIMLTIVMVTMLVSLGGCYVVPLHDRGRGYDRHLNSGNYHDTGIGGHNRHFNSENYYDRRKRGYDRYWNGRNDHDRNRGHDGKR